MKESYTVLGLHKDPWHDTGASIVRYERGQTSFFNLAEERLNRQKHTRKFPMLSIKACMDSLGIKGIKDVDLVVMDYICNPDWRADYHTTPCETDTILNSVDPSKIKVINHHLAHAYNVFYSSNFKRAAILIVDGRGSDKETQSLFLGDENGIELIESTDRAGIGLLYSSVTLAIGFDVLQEGKTMGLAPYGEQVKGGIFNFVRQHKGIVTDYSSMLVDGTYDFNVPYGEMKDFRGRARGAFEVQSECEAALLHMAEFAHERTGAEFLCLSGGVGLNSVANYKILMSGIFKDIFINPAASDSGIPLGAALYGLHSVLGVPKAYAEISPYLGSVYSRSRIEAAIAAFEGYEVEGDDALVRAAKMLAENKILGNFHGRSEMGPRALGNRSILMSPLVAENKDVLNARVKHREAFRPFAPACLLEHTAEYFDIDRPSPYMLLVPSVREDKRSVIPAITHVDGTARLQTVARDFNPRFYTIIDEFFKAVGVPVLLNTSFNVAGEPIVETPEDAIRCFMSTNIDALLIENYLLIKH